MTGSASCYSLWTPQVRVTNGERNPVPPRPAFFLTVLPSLNALSCPSMSLPVIYSQMQEKGNLIVRLSVR
jgi:hypothetical protein